jgi:hypothetical protein
MKGGAVKNNVSQSLLLVATDGMVIAFLLTSSEPELRKLFRVAYWPFRYPGGEVTNTGADTGLRTVVNLEDCVLHDAADTGAAIRMRANRRIPITVATRIVLFIITLFCTFIPN